MLVETPVELSFQDRIEALRAAKLAQTREKVTLTGSKDHDDHAIVLPPEDRRKIVKTMSSSGMPIVDCLLDGFELQPNHPSGGFFGPRCVGDNFRNLLEIHPPYVDPNSSLAGAYMANFLSYRKPHWNPDFSYAELQPTIDKYKLLPGVGAIQHFCQDLSIGLRLGWGQLLAKVRHYAHAHGPEKADFYAGLEAVVLGMQSWIGHNAAEARRMAGSETNPQRRQNLFELAEMNEWLVNNPPRTFREACQWLLWYQDAARMFNGSGSTGRLDVILYPYYHQEHDLDGTLSDEEATFHLACFLLRDTGYLQLGGPDAGGKDVTNPVSFLILEAAHWLKIPANIGLSVGENTSEQLLRRGVEILFQDKTGIPKFLGVDVTARDFARNGYPIELGRERAYSGCHWSAIPGREYTMNDCVKINFGAIFEFAWNEMMADASAAPGTAELWKRFDFHLREGVDTIARAMDFHMEHMHEVFPELMLDLLCYGPVEKGLDASNGGVEFYNLCQIGRAHV